MTNDTPIIEPFFEDPRSIAEKMQADERQWIPTRPEEQCPPMIAGLVLDRDVYVSDMNERDPNRETLLILELPNTEWSVIAFHGFLQSEIKRKNPRPGDFAVLAFNGTKPGKKGEKDAFIYKVFVERNPDGPAETAAAAAVVSPEPETGGGDTGDDIPFMPV